MKKFGVIFGIFDFEGHSRGSKLSKKGYFSSLKRCTVLEKDHKKWLPKWLLATILYKNHFKFHLMSCPYINLYFYKSTFKKSWDLLFFQFIGNGYKVQKSHFRVKSSKRSHFRPMISWKASFFLIYATWFVCCCHFILITLERTFPLKISDFWKIRYK